MKDTNQLTTVAEMKISDFERTALKQKAAAEKAVAHGDPEAVNLVQRWDALLQGFQFMKEQGVPEPLRDD